MNSIYPIKKSRLSLSFITPTFARDIERFALLRRSMNMFASGIPHSVFVDTEDLPIFSERFGEELDLQLIPTKDILPSEVEAERVMWRSWKGKLIDKVGWRLGLNTKFFSGWKLQQIVKLEALAACKTDAAVFLDSDIIFCGAVDPQEFIDDENNVRLLETSAKNYEDFAFEISSQILMGGSLLSPANAFNYIHQAPRFLKRTGLTLKAHLVAAHENWYSKFFAQNSPSEYSLLGYVARELEGYVGYRVEGSDQEEWCYNIKRKSDFYSCLDLCKEESGKRKFLLIQSNLGMPFSEFFPPTDALLKSLVHQPGFAEIADKLSSSK